MSAQPNEIKKEKRIEKVSAGYQRVNERYSKAIKSQENFLEKNDRRLEALRKRNEEVLKKHREMYDARLKERREKIEEKFIKDDEERKDKFEERKKKTDEFIALRRSGHDRIRKKHRERIDEKYKNRRSRMRSYIEDEKTKALNILERTKNEKSFNFRRRKTVYFIAGLIFAVFMFFTVEHILPGSKLKKKEVIKDTPIEEEVEIIPEMEYDTLPDITEEQYLWLSLLEHFDGNETAAMGVMCNIRAESMFKSSNLEDYNNDIWDIDDEAYTEKVNRKTIDKKDFAESRNDNMTNGYYNEYDQWVNRDGGYGFAQFTAYVKKEELYLFAEQWFGPGGEGEGFKFNIGDPKMQAKYVVYILESDDYSRLDNLLRNAGSVVDACYYWLKYYEVPYDPYCDDYYTLAFERADYAEDIKELCKDVSYEDGAETEVE